MLLDLNEEQKQAVTHAEGPLLIFAGAGSGKTRVITYRIAWLIEQGIVNPEGILAVTFTRKAAGEMNERVRSLLAKEKRSALPYIGTFHSFGALMLRKEGSRLGIPAGFSIYDPDDSIHVIKQIMDDCNIDKKQFNPNNIKNNISTAKNDMISPEEYPTYVQGPFDEVVAEVYPLYEDALRTQGAVDFDDLQIKPLELFQTFEDVRNKYNERYKYVLVDEYQDTNMIQYNLVKHLAGSHHNICVVGDDDQGIYSWRGATIQNILNFERDFPDTTVIRLEKNYRSTRNILHAAQSVISHNNERAQKDLWTDAEHGQEIQIYEARNERDEASYVIRQIENYIRGGGSLEDVGILYRVNAQSRAIEEELLRHAIPYRLVGGVRFYERREIKDMLAYLRFLANPRDELSFFRVINIPPRKIGKKSVEEIRETARDASGGKIGAGLLVLMLWAKISAVTDWDTYFPGIDIDAELADQVMSHKDIEDFKGKYASIISLFGTLYESSIVLSARQLIDEILEDINYEEWIDDGTPQTEARMENLFELKVVADKHAPLGPRDSLLAFLEDVALVEQDQGSDELSEGQTEEGVTLMTLHSAKGLEFDTVFLVGVEEGLFPHARSFTSPSELEEERRLCYVGITRARKKLYITFAENRNTYGGMSDRIPSRFISEIPQDIVEFESWN